MCVNHKRKIKPNNKNGSQLKIEWVKLVENLFEIVPIKSACVSD